MSAGKGRTYRYYRGEPLFPFGYGLSYTTFKYSNLVISGDPLKGEKVSVSFDVENTGKVRGEEVSQIYITTVNVPGMNTTDEPIKALKWFKRHATEAGASVSITASLDGESFMVFDESTSSLVLRPGTFRVGVGGSSADSALIVQEVTFTTSGGRRSNGGGSEKGIYRWRVVIIASSVVAATVIVGVMIVVYRRRKCEEGPNYECLEPREQMYT
jgi:hypothetical protein